MEFIFPKTKNWMIVGGGILLQRLIKYLDEKSCNLTVVCGERHLEEKVEGNRTLKEKLRDSKINFITSSNINKDERVIAKISDDTIGVSLDAPWIFRKDFIDLFKGKLVNSHGARLPQDRGGGGFSWRILKNDRLGFSVLHQVDPGIDTGEIVKIKEFLYPSSCRIPSDYFKYSIEEDIALLKEFYNETQQGKPFKLTSQPEYLSIYWPRLHTDIHGYINWSWKLKYLESFICAFDDPYAGASTFINGEKVRIKKSLASVSDGIFHPFQAGFIYRKAGGTLAVATEDGSLLISNVINQDGEDIVDKLKIGDRFFTPDEFLRKACEFRAIYTSRGLKTS